MLSGAVDVGLKYTNDCVSDCMIACTYHIIVAALRCISGKFCVDLSFDRVTEVYFVVVVEAVVKVKVRPGE